MSVSEGEEEEDGFVVASPTADRGGDDTEVSSDEEDDEEFSLRKRFDEILNTLRNSDIKDSSNVLRDPTKVMEYAQSATYLAEKTTGDGDHNTLLHLLVEDARDKVFEKYQPLLSALLQYYPQLLKEKDSNEKTPLYIAISKKREKVVRLMCTAEKEIDTVFRISCYQSNCLHLAIKRNVAPKLVIFLIGLASKETLCAKDDRGNTPLHLAVDYERCIDTQLDVVKAFIDRCDEAMDVRTNVPNSFSPYQWHEHSRNLAIKAAETEKRTREKEAAQAVENYSKQKAVTSIKIDPKTVAGPKGQSSHGGSATPGMEPPIKSFNLKRVNTSVEAPSDKGALAVPLRPAGPASVDGRSKDGSKKKSKVKSKEEAKVTEESANAVKNYLKLHCLRTRNDDDAVNFLYGKNQENQIYFDLYDTPSLTISEERIENGLAHLQFEDVLQYVALPSLHVERAPVPAKLKKQQQQDGNGRRDMEFLFDFLREKNVKRVIRVIVDDTSDPPHSDESIEKCLGGLRVEVWDWRKIDLCSETILTAAPDVTEVSLYWSGNNAVLRSWSDREGLNLLSKLKTVHLIVHQGLESSGRTKKNIRDFKNRLKNLRPEIVVDTIKDHQNAKHDLGGAAPDSTHPQAEPGHKWLTCMDDFADFIQNVVPPLPITQPVTIALIDDGVDVNEPFLHAKIIGGRSFCQRDRFQNLSMPYYVTSGGHGTVMASLICRVCPNAQLYVLKLDEYMGDNQKRQITAKSAEKAVRAAIAKGVHIISMSWTIEMTALNQDDVSGLESAIEEAAKAGILMFCAANDQGIARDRSFPSASSTKHIFKIGAAEASGVIWKWAGDPNDVDFIFPGHNVVKDRPNDAPLDRCKTLTGSSVATAVASGLAALILYCIQLGALNTQALKLGGNAPTMKDFEAVKGHERMKEAFLAIGTSLSSGNKYIEVWDVFGEAAKKAESANREQRVQIVADIAGRLKTTKKYN